MDRELTRFYAVMECFIDDDRVAAQAIYHFKNVDCSPEMIYKDLLACRYSAWIDYLESIANEMTLPVLLEWSNAMQFKLDMMRSTFWSKGDDKFIEIEAWKV